MNTYPIESFIIAEDGIFREEIVPLMKEYPQIKWLFLGDRVGQLKALDYAYSLVETKWIFHLEDDW